jgi:signal transduction histidine kinase
MDLATRSELNAMRKNRPFPLLFTVYFTAITAVTTAVFIFFGLGIIDRFFSYYVDKVHEETRHMLVMQAASYYRMYGTWDAAGDSWVETGAAAKLSGDYFTINDAEGKIAYSSEIGVERCCANPNHVYTQVKLPILVDGRHVGELRAGYFTNHITSPEADAFRGSGVSLVILSIICISLSGAFVSILFFFRLSRPIRSIANAAKKISHGHLQSRIVIKSNVSEMHEIADSINALGTSLLNQEKFRQQLIVELSHELRTPLQILLNQIEAMLDGIYTADKARLEAMQAEIIRTGELLNELEDRLIYENDVFDLNIAPTNISEIAQKVAIGHEGFFAQKGLDFSYTIEPEITIKADSIRFAQVLINLLSNAQKYTAAGSVSFSLKRSDNSATIMISDTGEGMDDEVIGNINKRSALTFKAVNSKGVGLYIAKLIIDKHGWHLHIDSQKNAGTRITIIL